MNRFTILVIILIVGGGYYIFQDQKKDLAKLICSDHLRHKRNPVLMYIGTILLDYRIKLLKKNLSEYKNKLKA